MPIEHCMSTGGIHMGKKSFHTLDPLLEVQPIFLPITLLSILFFSPLTHRPTNLLDSVKEVCVCIYIHTKSLSFKQSRQPLASSCIHWEDFPSPSSLRVKCIGHQSCALSQILLSPSYSLSTYQGWMTTPYTYVHI